VRARRDALISAEERAARVYAPSAAEPDNAIGERAARHMLFDGAARLQHTDQQTAIDCAALVDRIDAPIRPA